MSNVVTKNRNVQRLVLNVIQRDAKRDSVTFRISAQTLRGKWFADENVDEDEDEPGVFKTRDMHIVSVNTPALEWSVSPKVLYVRGANIDEDDSLLVCTQKQFDIVSKAVKAFNVRFMGSPNPIVDPTVEAASA